MLRYDHPDRNGLSTVSAIVLEDRGAVVGIAPFVEVQHAVTWKLRLPRRHVTILRFQVSAVEVPSEDLIAPDDPDARRALIDGLFEECRAIDVIRFPYSGARLRTLQKAKRDTRRWVWAPEGDTPVLTVRMKGDFATYLRETLIKKRRDNVRRERAILERVDETPLRLRRIATADEVGHFLDQAEGVFANSWHAERGANSLRKDARTEERFRWQAEHGWLRCYVLLKGEEPIAFLLGLQCLREFRALRTAFSASWARYSPGKVLWFSALEDLYESGEFDEFNFGYGAWEYKRIMATDSYTVTTQEAIRPALRNAVIWSGPVVYSVLRAAAEAALTRFDLRDRAERWSRRHLAR